MSVDRGTRVGALTPVLAVMRSNARDRLRSHAALGGLVAATVAMGLAVLSGAQRSESALARLRADSHSSDVIFYVDEADLAGSLDELAGVDGIEEVGVASAMFVRPAGSDLIPDYQLLALSSRPDLGGASLDVPRIVAGRGVRPEAADEVVLSEEIAAELDLRVGDRTELESMTEGWIDIAFNGGDPGPPDGPVVDVEVVGLARTPGDFGRFAGHLVHLSPAFAAEFEDQVRTYTWVSARISEPTEEGLDALRSGPLGALSEAEEGDVSIFADAPATNDGLSTIAVSLRLLAGAAVLAGLTIIGLTLARLARETLAMRETLSAIGWTRPQLVQLVALTLGPWLLGGIATGLVVGAIASPWALVGLARAVDPDAAHLILYPGLILGVGIVSTLGLAGLLGITAVRAARLRSESAALGRAVPPLASPLAIPLAIRRAIFGASDRGGRASRGAGLAVAASVTVAVAAMLVGASIQRLQDDPSLSGQGAADQRVIDSGESTEVYDQAMAALEGDDRAGDLVGVHVAFGVLGPGGEELSTLVFDVRKGDLGAAVVSGRTPVSPDEVAVGPATLEDLDLAVGDEVGLSSEHGAAGFRIVGETLFPEGDFRHDSGVSITAGGADRLLGGIDAGTSIHQVAFSWAAGVDVVAADRSLADQDLQIFTTGEGLQPAVVSNLAEVRGLPRLLALVVIALGLVTLVHALVITTRSRARETGTLRALGLRPRAIGALVEVQAIVLVIIALGAGIPLGLALGRLVWSPIADRANVVEVAVLPWSSTTWMTLAVLVSAGVAALPIVVRALRTSPGDALRSE